MFLRTFPLAGLFAAGALAAGLLLLPSAASALRRVAAAPAPPPEAPDRLLIAQGGRLVLLDPDGKNERRVGGYRAGGLPPPARLSPDGAWIAVCHPATADPDGPENRVYLRRVGGKEPGTDTGVDAHLLHWSADGAALVATTAAVTTELVLTHVVLDLKTLKAAPLPLPPGHIVAGWRPDGRFVTTRQSEGMGPWVAHIALLNRDGTEDRALTDRKDMIFAAAVSPDGARVLCHRPRATDGATRADVVVLDAATGRRTPLADIPLNAGLFSARWSPDGRRIAYAWRREDAGAAGRDAESHLVVADADGRNARTVLTVKDSDLAGVPLMVCDWR